MSEKPDEQDTPRPADEHNVESSRFFSTLARVSPVGIFRTDVQGNCTYVNDCWCKITGMTQARALGGGWSEAVHPEDQKKVAQAWYTSAQARQHFIMEYRIQRPNGMTRWVQGEAAAETDAAGVVIGYVGAITDITQSKQLEEAKQEALARLQKIASQVPGVVFQFRLRPDGSSCVPYASAAIREIYRISPEEVREDAAKAFIHIHPDDLENHLASIQVSARDLTPWRQEYRLVFDEGTIRWLFGNALPQREVDGSTLWHGFITDITEHKKSEERLRQSEEKLRAFLGNISDVIWLIDADLNMTYVSPSVTHMLGMLPEELIDRPSALVIHPDDMGVVSNAQRYVMEHPGEPHTIQYRVSHKYGRWIHVESTGVNMLDNPVINGVLVSMRDITERKLAENALRASENRYRLLVESSPFCIHEIGLDGRLQSMNRAGLGMLGLEDAMKICGTPYLGTVSPQNAEQVGALLQDAISNGTSSHFEFASAGDAPQHFKSCFIPIKGADGKVLKLMGITEDVTARKQSEEMLRFHSNILQNLAEGIFLIRASDGVIVFTNPQFERMFGYAPGELVGKHVSIVNAPGEESPEEIAVTIMSELARTEMWSGEVLNNRKDQTTFWCQARVSTFEHPQFGKVWVSVHEDITERKRADMQIHNLAFYDPLTQLPNRRLLNDRLEQAMVSSKRSGRYGALMFLDLDNFKPLNDTYGHDVGDLLLIKAAYRIAGCVRETDTVARFGGDEFMVMLGELDMDKAESATQARIVAEKIRTALAEPYVLKIRYEGQAETIVEHHCTSSIGVVLFIGHQGRAEDIVKWADMAMYRAKDAGRNLIRFYE